MNTLTVTNTPAAPTTLYGGGSSTYTGTINVNETNASNLLTINTHLSWNKRIDNPELLLTFHHTTCGLGHARAGLLVNH